MKRVTVVSKTHLDLGFTDYAENIRRKYIEHFIPDAINLANAVNGDKKRFVWTTGSWILKEALENSPKNEKEKLIKALKDGYICAHAMPFTTHTELLNCETLDYGLKIKERIEEITGKKIVAAKMTDVPGHTKGLVHLLAKHGIKLLHIGVNGVSAVPDVPPCFLWKCGDDEVAVIYSGDYGGAFECEYTDEVLYLDHTVDNRGAPTPEKAKKRFEDIEAKFPDYEICAGTLDDYAEIIWQIRNKLPVITDEIGDTWIHGAAADPYKTAALKELCRLQEKFVNSGTLQRDSEEYNNFSDALLCIAEHTWGMDSKMFFADFENYLKRDFITARKNDKVKLKDPYADYPQNMFVKQNRESGVYKDGYYSVIEKSWKEQRLYIEKAVDSLQGDRKNTAIESLTQLIPQNETPTDTFQPFDGVAKIGENIIKLNKHGGIADCVLNGTHVIKNADEPVLEYRSYGQKDYEHWFTHYSRNLEKNREWGFADFGKPLLCCVDGKYPQGSFFYRCIYSGIKYAKDCAEILVKLKCDPLLCEELGAPRSAEILYTLTADSLKFCVSWFEKDANRLPEAIFLHILPNSDTMLIEKLANYTDYSHIVGRGGKKLHGVTSALFECDGNRFKIMNRHSPLLSPGKGKILEYDNQTESIADNGISYVLCNNVWGTNFPLWYEDNASFEFEIVC